MSDDTKNWLYRLHFPCRKKRCNCDKIIKDAEKYLDEKVKADGKEIKANLDPQLR